MTNACHRTPPIRPPRRVLSALSALAIEPLEIRVLGAPDAASPAPRTFLVIAADGRRLKARVARSAVTAARAAKLAECLGDPRLPAPIARAGAVTVEAWVEGTALSSLTLSSALVGQAADLLSRVHQYPGHRRAPLPQMRRVEPVRVRAEHDLDVLTAAGVVGRGVRRHALTIIARGLPVVAPWGLTHGDLCAPNLVLARGGSLVSIDNEHLRRGHLDHDVARTWYRWPLSAPAQRCFDAAYARAGGPAQAGPARQAWRVVATVRAVGVRHRLGTPFEGPLRRLDAALQDD